MGYLQIVGVLVLLGIGLTALPTHAQQDSESSPYRVIAYYPSWATADRNYPVADIPADQITHINYAFANIAEDGTILIGDEWADIKRKDSDVPEGAPYAGNFRQLNLLKEQHPHLQTLISVGGWGWSARFSDVALTEASRAKFARSCVKFMLQYGFDGVDIDWEYPGGGGDPRNVERPQDPDNFILLLAELRHQLDLQGEQDGRHYLLTIAAPAGASQYRNLSLDQIHPSLDWINIMTYDYAGPWSEVTSFNAPLYGAVSADSAIQAYLAAGVPNDKLVMGVPFYGHGWQGVAEGNNNGLGQPHTGASLSGLAYKRILQDYLGDFQRYWDETAQVAWLYDAESQTFITYDDADSLQLKAEYIQANQLGGVMIWEITLDDDDHPLLNALTLSLNSK